MTQYSNSSSDFLCGLGALGQKPPKDSIIAGRPLGSDWQEQCVPPPSDPYSAARPLDQEGRPGRAEHIRNLLRSVLPPDKVTEETAASSASMRPLSSLRFPGSFRPFVFEDGLEVLCSERIRARYLQALNRAGSRHANPFVEIQSESHKAVLKLLKGQLHAALLNQQPDSFLVEERLRLASGVRIPWEPRVRTHLAENGKLQVCVVMLLELRNSDGKNLHTFQNSKQELCWRVAEKGAVLSQVKRTYQFDDNWFVPVDRIDLFAMYSERAFINELEEMDQRIKLGDDYDYPNGQISIESLLQTAAAAGFGRLELARDQAFLDNLTFTKVENNISEVLDILRRNPHALDYSPNLNAYFMAHHPELGDMPVMVHLDLLCGFPMYGHGRHAQPRNW